MDEPETLRQPPSIAALFMGFLGIGLIGFGGVLPLARHMLVDQKRWLTGASFTELLGLCQSLPGGNVINLSIAVGLEFQGLAGAAASLLGLLAAPTGVVIGLGILYDRFQDEPRLREVFAGLAAAAAGLLVCTALKILMPLGRKPWSMLIVVLFLGCVGWLRLPLPETMLVLVPLSIFLTWRKPC